MHTLSTLERALQVGKSANPPFTLQGCLLTNSSLASDAAKARVGLPGGLGMTRLCKVESD
jgi:hypothetical protein